MDQDAIEDLKQFITATMRQQLVGLRQEMTQQMTQEITQQITAAEQRLEQKLGQKIEKLGQRLEQKLGSKIDDLSASVARALDTINEQTDAQLKNHEHRITRLEQHAPLAT